MKRMFKQSEPVGLPLLKQSVNLVSVLLTDSQVHRRTIYTASLAQAVLADFHLTLPAVSRLLTAMESQGLVRSYMKFHKNCYLLSRKAIIKFLGGDTDGNAVRAKGGGVHANLLMNDDPETYKDNNNKSSSLVLQIKKNISTSPPSTVTR